MLIGVHTHILPAEYLEKLISWVSDRQVTSDPTGRTLRSRQGTLAFP